MKQSMKLETFEWAKSAPMHTHLPYKFSNGLEFNGLNSQCGKCGEQIQEDYLRGELVVMENDRCMMLAKGYCPDCNAITCYNFLIEGGDDPCITDLGDSLELAQSQSH